jgi:hypothetical protein
MIKKVFKAAILALGLLVIWKHQLILYGLSQARGQLHVVINAREIPK